MMRTLFILIFSSLLLVGCAGSTSYEINKQATAQAPWSVGEIVYQSDSSPYVRKFLGMTTQGYYLVQDFYTGTKIKFTDPYTIISQEGVTTDDPMAFIDGALTLWYENGHKKAEGHPQGKKMQGFWTYWHENGTKFVEGLFQDGRRQGFWRHWYENGQIRAEGQYQNGEKQGVCRDWDKDGNLIGETDYNSPDE